MDSKLMSVSAKLADAEHTAPDADRVLPDRLERPGLDDNMKWSTKSARPYRQRGFAADGSCMQNQVRRAGLNAEEYWWAPSAMPRGCVAACLGTRPWRARIKAALRSAESSSASGVPTVCPGRWPGPRSAFRAGRFPVRPKRTRDPPAIIPTHVYSAMAFLAAFVGLLSGVTKAFRTRIAYGLGWSMQLRPIGPYAFGSVWRSIYSMQRWGACFFAGPAANRTEPLSPDNYPERTLAAAGALELAMGVGQMSQPQYQLRLLQLG